MKIFLISPVRNCDPSESERIRRHVEALERYGHTVHSPARDTKQDDPVGLKICQDNREALYHANEVHIWYDPESRGSRFDLGMWFAFSLIDTMNERTPKKLVSANIASVRKSPRSVYRAMILNACDRKDYFPLDLVRLSHEFGYFQRNGRISFLPTIDRTFPVVELGMLFALMRDHPKQVHIPQSWRLRRTEEKSFENVLLAMIDRTRNGPARI